MQDLLTSIDSLSREELLELLEATSSAALPDESKLSLYVPTSEVIKKFHSSTSKLRALLSGNRGGKTATLCVETVIRTTGLVPKTLDHIYPKEKIRLPCYARLVGVDFSSGIEKILRPELLKWLPREMIHSTSDSLRVITLYTGSKIEFMSYDQEREKFGGTSRQLVGFDEVPPPDIFRENQMRVADAGGDLILGFTAVPEYKDNRGRVTSNAESIAFFNKEVYQRASRVVDEKSDTSRDGFPGYECFHHNSLRNVHINLLALKEWADTLPEKERLSRIEGKFSHLVGLVYGDVYDETKHVVDDFPIPEDWPVFVAIDPHLNVKRTPHHVSFMTVDPHNRKIICDELKVAGTIDELAREILRLKHERSYWILFYLIDPIASTNDPITGSCIANELTQREIAPLLPGSKDMMTGIANTKEAFREDTLHIFKSCKGHRWELAHYVYAGEKPLDKDDHFCENLRRLILRRPFFIDKQMYERDLTRTIEWVKY